MQTSGDRAVRANYAAAARAQRERIATSLRHAGAAHLQLRTDRDWITDVVRFVIARRRFVAGAVGAEFADAFPVAALLLLLLAVVAARRRLRGAAAVAARDTSPGSATSSCSAASRRGGPGWRRHLTFALLLIALTVLCLGVAGPSGRHGARAAGRGDGDAGHRRVAVDGGDRRAAVPASRPRRRRPRSSSTCCRRGSTSAWWPSAAQANVLVSPTLNRDAVKASIDKLQLQRVTAIGEAIFTSLNAIKTYSPGDHAEGRPSRRPPGSCCCQRRREHDGPQCRLGRNAARRRPTSQVSTIAFGTEDRHGDPRRPDAAGAGRQRHAARYRAGRPAARSTPRRPSRS